MTEEKPTQAVARLLYNHDKENFGWRKRWEAMSEDDRQTWLHKAPPFVQAVVDAWPFEAMMTDVVEAALAATDAAQALLAAMATFREAVEHETNGVESGATSSQREEEEDRR